LASENAEEYGAWLLIASAVLFGLPHGAYDFWILFKVSNTRNRISIKLLSNLLCYLLIAVSIVGFWYIFPKIALVSFLFLSVWHFGSGDAVWENRSTINWILTSIGRGCLLIFAPLTFFPIQSGNVLNGLVGMESVYVVSILLAVAPYFLVFGVILLLINCLFSYSKQTAWVNEVNLIVLAETTVLILFYYLTTPLLAVTIYLIGVHSWRHLLRLNLYENIDSSLEAKSLINMICRFHIRALPITILSLFGIVFIFWFWKLRLSDLSAYTSAYLILLSALTVPHAILITISELKYRNSLTQ
jgi:beta-carotene 15,15'-dioxygenase